MAHRIVDVVDTFSGQHSDVAVRCFPGPTSWIYESLQYEYLWDGLLVSQWLHERHNQSMTFPHSDDLLAVASCLIRKCGIRLVFFGVSVLEVFLLITALHTKSYSCYAHPDDLLALVVCRNRRVCPISELPDVSILKVYLRETCLLLGTYSLPYLDDLLAVASYSVRMFSLCENFWGCVHS